MQLFAPHNPARPLPCIEMEGVLFLFVSGIRPVRGLVMECPVSPLYPLPKLNVVDDVHKMYTAPLGPGPSAPPSLRLTGVCEFGGPRAYEGRMSRGSDEEKFRAIHDAAKTVYPDDYLSDDSRHKARW